jgi:hypothetical protein
MCRDADLVIQRLELRDEERMERRTYTRREVVKGGAAALLGASLALPLASRRAGALTRGVSVGIHPSGNGPLYNDFAELDAYINLAGGIVPKLVSVFSAWVPQGSTTYLHPNTDNLSLFYNRYPGSVLVWTWEPRYGVTLQQINSGAHDAYIDEVARRIGAVGKRVLIRFAHEMNGTWSWPWVNQPPADYIAAWTRIVSRFRVLGVTNAEWVWSPNVISGSAPDFTPWYPGDAYVDWTGLDGYNWGSVFNKWKTFRELFLYSIGVISALSRRGIIIAETGCHSRGPNNEDKGSWYTQMAAELKQNYPQLLGLIYMHMIHQRNNGEDGEWQVDMPITALDDWQNLVADPQFQAPLGAVITAPADNTAPAPPIINSPANNSFDTDANITLSGTAEAGSKIQIFEGTTPRGTLTTANSSGSWSKALTGVTNGSHTYTAKATDAANNTSGFSNARTVIVDTIKPRVSTTTPPAGATGVSPTTNVSANFSEAMSSSTLRDPTTLRSTTFTLRRTDTTTQVAATVSYNATTKTATLNPDTNLKLGTTYIATVTTGARDLAGNALDQDPTKTGNQPKTWSFTVRRT